MDADADWVIENIPVNALNAARLCVAGKKTPRDYLKFVLIDAARQEIIATDGRIMYYAWGLAMRGTLQQALIYMAGKAIGETATLKNDRLVTDNGLQTQFVRYWDPSTYPNIRQILPARTDVLDETPLNYAFQAQYLAQAERCFGKAQPIRLLPRKHNLILRPYCRRELLYVMAFEAPLSYTTYYGDDPEEQEKAA